MTLTVFAPSPEGAALLAQRVRPRARIGEIVELPFPATQESLSAFWGEVKRLTARTATEIHRGGITVRKRRT